MRAATKLDLLIRTTNRFLFLLSTTNEDVDKKWQGTGLMKLISDDVVCVEDMRKRGQGDVSMELISNGVCVRACVRVCVCVCVCVCVPARGCVC